MQGFKSAAEVSNLFRYRLTIIYISFTDREKPSKCKCFVPLGEVTDFAKMEDPDKDEEPYNFCHWPKDSLYEKLVWLLSYPWELLFFITIPSVRRGFTHNWIFSCLIMSICWISLLTYLCSWTMTVVGRYIHSKKKEELQTFV